MELNQQFVSLVSDAIEELWEASVVMRVAHCCWAQTPEDALNFCIDHERFCERSPDIARLIKRAIDVHGHDRVTRYLAEHVKLHLNPQRV